MLATKISQDYINSYPCLGRLLLLMNGDFSPFVGLTHHVGEKFGVPKDGFGGVVWLGIE